MKRNREELLSLNLVEVNFTEQSELIKDLQEVLKETYSELIKAQMVIDKAEIALSNVWRDSTYQQARTIDRYFCEAKAINEGVFENER